MSRWRKRLREFYAGLGWETRCLVAAGALSLIPALVFELGSGAAAPVARSEAADVTTFIPKGFVLVPIEARNYEAVDSILGQFGMVDLMRADPAGGARPTLVARNVRLLRAPHNPSHFAILIREEETGRVLAGGSSFVVIIKPPGAGGTEFVTAERKSRRTIVYEGGNP